ncbi:hypothetical protein KOW79_012088 [Hemibagrus wyckioides]|uniref:Uncharacterized protein n=1 Tax=Hemibagrus wyckioides TaxID=337641 RepID=A0A9D3NKT0_9TELE|nr:hypothetical protein KOW79_012088 [Hemibagrus wyckioides]
MAGGPPKWNKISEPGKVNIDVGGGGVQTGAILEGNLFQGKVTSRTNYTGPPARDGAGPVAPREHNDGGISVRNEGSQSHQPIAHNNAFLDDVVFEQNVNIQPAAQRDDDRMDLK